MKEINGLFWPDWDDEGWRKIPLVGEKSIERVLAHVPRRRAVIQAGACVGYFPIKLAECFELVFTFEPDPDNFQCLQRNLGTLPNVLAYHVALGERDELALLHRVAGNAGASFVGNPGNRPAVQAANVAVKSIDSFATSAIDLIWLSTAGYEVPILRGAFETIHRCRPVVVIGVPPWDKGEGHDLLRMWGYREVETVPLRDTVMVPA